MAVSGSKKTLIQQCYKEKEEATQGNDAAVNGGSNR